MFTGFHAVAQKQTEQQMDAAGIHTLHIMANEVYKIRILAAETNTIHIKTLSEGEYYNNIGLKSEIKDGELLLKSQFPDKLAGGYDKLSTHKVFSLEIWLEVPEGMEVDIQSNLASVEAEGNFGKFSADLQQGYCFLTDFTGAAMINTFEGDIEVHIQHAQLQTESRHGTVTVPEFISGNIPVHLRTINGDIRVLKN
ncbi:MAG: hypothetical protein WCE57_13685 [Salegentibacter sp.]